MPLRRRDLLLGLAALPFGRPAGAAATGFVRAEGRHFIGHDGRPVLLKGINLGNWLMPEGYMFKFEGARSPRQIRAVIDRLLGPDGAADFWRRFRETYVTEDDIRFIADAGFNLIRIPLHWDLFVTPGTPPRFEGEGWALLDRAIGWARAAGLMVMMDMHAAPGGQTGINHDDGPGYPLMFYVPAHRRLTVDLWTQIARRYRDEPTVIGYDLLNEPIAPYHDTHYLNPRLEPFYREATAAIRAVNPNHIIFLAGGQWSTNFDTLGPPFAENLGYTYHKFWSSTGRDAIQSYLNFSLEHDVPVLLGESGELTDEWMHAFRTLHERHGLSWCFWTFKNLHSKSTVASIRRPADWDAVTDLANRPQSTWHRLPPKDRTDRALAEYLANIPLARTEINWSYLAALGLKGAP